MEAADKPDEPATADGLCPADFAAVRAETFPSSSSNAYAHLSAEARRHASAHMSLRTYSRNTSSRLDFFYFFLHSSSVFVIYLALPPYQCLNPRSRFKGSFSLSYTPPSFLKANERR